MLEVKNLTKIYKPKKGVPVKALDNLSLKFPEKGMVFLLGKSGSGKSTLLNLLGGLDKYDGGEIIIKGVSSKKFRQQHFDSYRNTYVGFIFQEYNILDEFTVGANIALAIELQGRKAKNEEINKILKEVDLEGYGNRRPNELSGGQKQRVAIARALVKSPKIIMADEPTGALDSVTGKQVFDTLKKLSAEKLVIVVSHDRDFASRYADRIIELADGRVISDTSLTGEETPETEGLTFEGEVARIPKDYRLTEADRIAINEYLDRLAAGGSLEFTSEKGRKNFLPTDESKITTTDLEPFKLIKSKLSLRHAFKIGSSGLKHKKVRLVFTIILSCIAFVLFGLADTFGAYDHIKTCTRSLTDSNIGYAALSKSVYIDEGGSGYWKNWGERLTVADFEQIKQDTGIDFRPVATDPNMGEISFANNLASFDIKNEMYNIYAYAFYGMIEVNAQEIQDLGYKIVGGKLPEKGKNEIAISSYIAMSFMELGYSPDGVIDMNGVKDGKVEIKKPADMVGKVLRINGKEYTVTAVIDTNLDWERYSRLNEADENQDSAEMILNYALFSEFNYAVQYSHAGLVMVAEGDLDAFVQASKKFKNESFGDMYWSSDDENVDPYYYTTLKNIDTKDVIWLDGERKTLAEKEIILSCDLVNALTEQYDEYGMPIGYDKDSLNRVKNTDYTMHYWNYMEGDREEEIEGYKVVGIIDIYNNPQELDCFAVVSDKLMNTCFKEEGDYTFLLGAMPKGEAGIRELVSYCYKEDATVRYPLNNPVCFELDSLNDGLGLLATVFLYIGLGFALFAAVLLSNFIATSISYKKQEIGILRAIGSRGNDVFRIFFAESFIIAMINFVLSCIAVFAITTIINLTVRNNLGLLLTVFNFGFRQLALIFAVSIVAAFIASFLPVKKIASMRPIDAIRNR